MKDNQLLSTLSIAGGAAQACFEAGLLQDWHACSMLQEWEMPPFKLQSLCRSHQCQRAAY